MKKKILIASRDPGGTNAVLPLIGFFQKEYSVIVLGKDVAIEIYNKENIEVNEQIYSDEFDYLKEIIEKYLPAVIITGTSSDDFFEKRLWGIARIKNIPSIAVLDHWVNYGIRFSKYTLSQYSEYNRELSHDYIPDKILVMDDYAKNKLIEEGVDEEKLVVTGQPHFKWLSDKSVKCRKNISKQKDSLDILYVSEPYEKIYGGRENSINALGYSEKTIFQELLKTLNRLEGGCFEKKVRLFIKQHPKENDGAYDEYLKECHFPVYYEKRKDLLEFLPDMDIVCGMTSMMLIEAYICGKNVISLQFGKNNNSKFILDELGILYPVKEQDELEKELKKPIGIIDRNKLDKIFKRDVFYNIKKVVESLV